MVFRRPSTCVHRAGVTPLRAGCTRVVRVTKAGEETVLFHWVHPQADGATKTLAAGFSLGKSTPTPPASMTEALIARFKASKMEVVWKDLQDSPRPAPRVAPEEGRSPADYSELFLAIAHQITVQNTVEARRLMASIPPNLDPWSRIEAAYLWVALGEAANAEALLREIAQKDAIFPLVQHVLLTPTLKLPDALQGVTQKDACDLSLAVDLLDRLNRAEEGVELAQALRTLDPDCVSLWELEIRLLLQIRKGDQAKRLGFQAMKRFPKTASLWTAMAYVYQSSGELLKAVELFDASVRMEKPTSLSMRNLLGTVVRNGDDRAEHLARYTARYDADPTDVISQMMVGVIHHYDNHFERSQEFLVPLEEPLGHVDRLHIYLAMNDFNLGRRADALRRLNRVASWPSPDADVFYCRAEILRDTDRQQARDDLERYRHMSEGRLFSNPEKDKRINALTELLDACLADDRSTCEGPWEHPRLRHEPTLTFWRHPVFLAALALLLIAGLFFLGQRRKRVAS
jgi:tetratricopeptide (TPR) repeat protein